LQAKLKRVAIPLHRPEGFANQHLVVLPQSVIRQMEKDPLLNTLFPTDSGCFTDAAGHRVERPSGSHEAILIVCHSGRGWVQIGERGILTVQRDEAVLIPPEAPHRYGADDEEPWSIMWAHFRGRDLREFLGLLGVTAAAPLIRVPSGAFDRMAFQAIYEQFEQGYTPPNLLASAARLRMVLAEINRLRFRGNVGSHSSEENVQATVEWMQSHLDDHPTLHDLALLAGISAPHYSALFRRRTGFAPVDYFLRLKIQRACQLLDTTEMRVDEIAAALGFADPYYFSRLFKKMMGHSPRAYRKITKG
jgi:AraC-like DNA-binding protein/mannose-6-phosphate isomerase-like protein (cupin superfamily)